MKIRPTLILALVAALAACSNDAPPADSAAIPAAPDELVPVAAPAADPIDAILAGSHRSDANKARDQYRHPKETLAFFGIQPNMTVIEITPGGGAWYTEILAPYLHDAGSEVAAIWDTGASDAPGYYAKNNEQLATKLASDPAAYDRVALRSFDAKAPAFGEANSADAVVTFRNVHNWTMAGNDGDYFKAVFDVLKPGGVLGVVEHRANAGTSLEATKETGYLTEDYVIGLATAAGFILEEKSEINANANDSKDHPQGVWTLPPSFALKDKDREKYAAIGESDRMTLRFRKPSESADGDASDDTAAQPAAGD
ncbi:MAG: class I SAM-dependent methyltransferase [Rhodanobacteraceae bacterium]|nr:class I SAM-dependent methyltransferase [Rhodanobacteraceae bacterium]